MIVSEFNCDLQKRNDAQHRATLDSSGRALYIELLNVIHVVAHRDEQIKEQLAPHLHLHLHGAAALKRLTASNNECEVMSAKARVRVRCVVVGISC